MVQQAIQLFIRVSREMLLPDNAQWTNRFYVRSESSNKLWTISQHKTGRYWGCSCPGYSVAHKKGESPKRYCKHLRELGLPGQYIPFEAKLGEGR